MRDVWALLAILRGRGNPLRHAVDRREAWVTLGALVLWVLGAPAAGLAGAAAADAALQRSAAAEREGLHAVDGVVVRPVPGRERYPGDPEATSERAVRPWVLASWRTRGGVRRTGKVPADADTGGPGSAVRIWTDAAGVPVEPPMDARTARTHALLGGVGTFLLAAGCVDAGRRLVARRVVRRRYARLDREWAATGPDWGRAGKGG
ncbi:hypothetical protein [Streptomyces sp. NPDC049916]|uniref:Rv1733c family protein n=1 Tax=Streptomyces sp. NPDC049916 TaxID=3155156 RepID=UPI0034433F74